MPPTPVSREIDFLPPPAALAGLAGAGTAFLDSALARPGIGRYAFLGIDPALTIVAKDGVVQAGGQTFRDDPLRVLERELARLRLKTAPELPPFQTGAMGCLGYDLCHHLERLPSPRLDDMGFPDLAIGIYDLILAFDVPAGRAWIVASGYPETAPRARKRRARRRLDALHERLADLPRTAPEVDLSPREVEVTSNFTRAGYEAAVRRVIDYIHAGDVFQANLSQRFMAETDLAPQELYLRLRALNPAPFAACLDLPGVALASASPERFLRLTGDRVETRPIKGTRPRGRTPGEDETAARELLESDKDRAENVMIVDLLRNDLSRVCRDHSVRTPEICSLESFATVHHLVSTVTGTLRPGQGPIDLLRATFPGGSITGAPKVRAMEIIALLEPTRRGPYCGCIGYIGLDGAMDTSITIRTFAMKDGIVTFQAGGGIVADSDPAAEYEETMAKAGALMRALGRAP
jgi:para-aminobenzoate synthetase component I